MAKYINAEEIEKNDWIMSRIRPEDAHTMIYEIKKPTDFPAIDIVRCKDCKHHPIDTGTNNYGQELEFPDEVCPCLIGDHWYSWMPEDNWFCADGERREDD